jgi:hypothetical protein
MTISEAASMLGRRGGQVKSAAKAAAARRNGQLGGKRKVTNAQAEHSRTSSSMNGGTPLDEPFLSQP